MTFFFSLLCTPSLRKTQGTTRWKRQNVSKDKRHRSSLQTMQEEEVEQGPRGLTHLPSPGGCPPHPHPPHPHPCSTTSSKA